MLKVLFFTYDFPYPTNTGGKNRAYYLLKHSGKDVEMSLFSFVRNDFSPDYTQKIKEIGVKKVKVFNRKKLKKLSTIIKNGITYSSIFKTLYYENSVEKELLKFVSENKIDIVHFESSYTGYYIGDKLRKLGVKQVLGMENIEHQLYFDYARNKARILSKLPIYYQAKLFKREEFNMMKKADAIVTVTKNEANFVEKNSKNRTIVIENGVEIDDFKLQKKGKSKGNLLFVGNFTYFPNVDAMQFFYSKVFKKIKGSVKLTIIGKEGEKRLNIDDKRVVFKKFVEDIRDEYKDADILVSPIRIGGGTNFKVLEAMALGTPIVAYSERLSEIGAVPGKHFLEAKNADEFIEQIKLLNEDSELRMSISYSARLLIEEKYSWIKIGKKLNSFWRSM